MATQDHDTGVTVTGPRGEGKQGNSDGGSRT